MNKEEIIDKILRDEPLTDLEQSWWQKNLAEGTSREDLIFLREMINPLHLENRRLLKSQLQDIEKNETQKSNSSETAHTEGRVLPLKKWLSIAAAIVIFSGGTFFLIFQNQKTNYLAQYFEPYPSIINPVLKGNTPTADPGDLAMVEYQNLRYQESLKLFEQIELKNDTFLFYQANALLALKKDEEALSVFQHLKNHENRFSEESAWYEALTLLNLKREEDASLALQFIVKNPKHPYLEEASHLLKKIE